MLISTGEVQYFLWRVVLIEGYVYEKDVARQMAERKESYINRGPANLQIQPQKARNIQGTTRREKVGREL